MARIIVQADDERTVLFDEREVRPTHLADGSFTAALMQRLQRAVSEAESTRVEPRRRPRGRVLPVQSGVGRTFD